MYNGTNAVGDDNSSLLNGTSYFGNFGRRNITFPFEYMHVKIPFIIAYGTVFGGCIFGK